MTLGAPCWTSGFVRLLCFIMATLAVFMKGILCGGSVPFLLGFVALPAQFAGGLTLFPGMVTLYTVDLEAF